MSCIQIQLIIIEIYNQEMWKHFGLPIPASIHGDPSSKDKSSLLTKQAIFNGSLLIY